MKQNISGRPSAQSSIANRLKGLARLIAYVGIALLFGGISWYAIRLLQSSDSEETAVLTYTVRRKTIEDTVVERGTIESQNTVYGVCELPGNDSSIVSIVPEGTFVKKGELIVKLESSKIDQQIAQKKIVLAEAEGKLKEALQTCIAKKNEGAGKILTAERELELAKIEVEKYRDGDSKSDEAELLRLIADGQAQLQKFLDERNNIEILVKKGYRSPEQLAEFRLRVNSLTKAVERDRQKLENLKKYEFKLKLSTFQGKETDARSKVERETSTAAAEVEKAESQIASARNVVALHEAELKELEDSLKNCEMMAPQDGTVAYANQPWFDSSQRIRNGAKVYRKQEIFCLPDMTNMQVKLEVHESVINRIRAGQKVTVRLDAFPDVRLLGIVKYVSELAATSFSDAKNYDAIVLIDSIPRDLALKPGMTAEVKILVNTYSEMLAIPIGAVTEHFQQSFVYMKKGNQFVRQPVTMGRTTYAFAEILSGIEEGDVLAMDAYQRGSRDFAATERNPDQAFLSEGTPKDSNSAVISEGTKESTKEGEGH